VSYRIDTVAGSDYVGDNGPATSALLFQADGIVADGAGNLFLSDAGNHRVRKITRLGMITTIAGTGIAGFSGDNGPANAAQLNAPYGLAIDGIGNLYVADLGNARVRRISPDVHSCRRRLARRGRFE
jgi:sugar lactone lactonase YvrE